MRAFLFDFESNGWSFLWQTSALGLLPGCIYLEEDVDFRKSMGAPGFGDLFSLLERINRLYGPEVGYLCKLWNLVGLQASDKVPLNVFGKFFCLFDEL